MRDLKIVEKITKRDSESLTRFFEEIKKYPILSETIQKVLLKQAQLGDKKAFDTLINCNLKFVVSVAKQYHYPGLLLNDLINYGVIGLIKVIDKADPESENKFLSYAVWWIRQSILENISKHKNVVKLPLNKILSSQRIEKIKSKFFAEFGRDPTKEEIIEISNENLEDYFIKKEISLSTPLFEDSETKTLEDKIYSEEDSIIDDKDNKKVVEIFLSKIPPREAEILIYYFGLKDNRELNLEEISAILNLTRERVRQLKEKAIRRLKNFDRKGYFKKI